MISDLGSRIECVFGSGWLGATQACSPHGLHCRSMVSDQALRQQMMWPARHDAPASRHALSAACISAWWTVPDGPPLQRPCDSAPAELAIGWRVLCCCSALNVPSTGGVLCRGRAQQTDHRISCNHVGRLLHQAGHVHQAGLLAASCQRAVLSKVLAGSWGHAWDMSGRHPPGLPLQAFGMLSGKAQLMWPSNAGPAQASWLSQIASYRNVYTDIHVYTPRCYGTALSRFVGGQ